MKKLMFIAIAIFTMVAIQTEANAQAAPAKKVNVIGSETNTTGVEMSLPAEDKKLEKQKDRGSCDVWFDNFTGYYVDIWVEGYYQGRLSPYATSVRIDVWTPGNWTKWTAQTAGKTYYWSNDSYCNDNRAFTISLK